MLLVSRKFIINTQVKFKSIAYRIKSSVSYGGDIHLSALVLEAYSRLDAAFSELLVVNGCNIENRS